MRMNVQMDSRRKIANVNGDILGIVLTVEERYGTEEVFTTGLLTS